jgi:hypothetical protein
MHTQVPLFVEETGNDPMSLVRRWVVMGYAPFIFLILLVFIQDLFFRRDLVL